LLKRIELYTDDNLPALEGIRIGTGLKVTMFFDLPKPTRSFDMGLAFDNMLGQRVCTAHSLFEPDRPVGEWVGPQVFVCEMPSFTLMPRMYHLRVWLGINHVQADLINQTARVMLVESDYYGTGKAARNGAVVLRRNWYVEQYPEVAL
jgi:hypothetical protein